MSVDPVQFGEVLAELRLTRQALERYEKTNADLAERLRQLEERYRIGRAGVLCLVLGAGFAIVGAKEFMQAAWKALVG